ncbi:collagen alpha-1(I) chain-like [Cervus canadensis]|uniref:collagen alpha-1(I) chain-like n=1 Tax=Cervus canadensis TaxID=1574408 RepID=UPI001CA30556|nr:collagen alpha-1(I) chain-like [Cervus canadensis]
MDPLLRAEAGAPGPTPARCQAPPAGAEGSEQNATLIYTQNDFGASPGAREPGACRVVQEVGQKGGRRATWRAPAPPRSPPAGVNFGAAGAGWAQAGGAAGLGWPRNPNRLAGPGGSGATAGQPESRSGDRVYARPAWGLQTPRAWNDHQRASPSRSVSDSRVGVRGRTSVPLETFPRSDLDTKPGPVSPKPRLREPGSDPGNSPALQGARPCTEARPPPPCTRTKQPPPPRSESRPGDFPGIAITSGTGVRVAERWPPARCLPRSRSGGSGSGAAPAPRSRRSWEPGSASQPVLAARVAPVSSWSYFLSRPQPSPHPPLPPRPPLRAAPRGAARRGLPSPPSPRLLPFSRPPPPPPLRAALRLPSRRSHLVSSLLSSPAAFSDCWRENQPPTVARSPRPVSAEPGRKGQRSGSKLTQRGESERERAATPGSGLGCAAGQRIRVAISSARPRLPRSATKMRRFPSFGRASTTRLPRSPRLPAGASARTLPGARRAAAAAAPGGRGGTWEESRLRVGRGRRGAGGQGHPSPSPAVLPGSRPRLPLYRGAAPRVTSADARSATAGEGSTGGARPAARGQTRHFLSARGAMETSTAKTPRGTEACAPGVPSVPGKRSAEPPVQCAPPALRPRPALPGRPGQSQARAGGPVRSGPERRWGPHPELQPDLDAL